MSRRVLLTILLAVCVAFTARRTFLHLQIEKEPVDQGRFEEIAGHTVLAVAPVQANFDNHISVYSYDSERMGVPPGFSITLPLPSGVEYRLQSPGVSAPAYVVFGYRQPVPPPGFSGVTSSSYLQRDLPLSTQEFLDEPQALDVDSGRHLVVAPWVVNARWKQDEDRLARIQQACVGSSEESEMSVRREGDAITFTLGHCQATVTVHAGNVLLGVLGGPDTATVRRLGQAGPFHYGPDLIAFGLVSLSGFAILIGFGFLPGALVAVALAVTSVFLPLGGLVVGAVAAVLGIVVGCLRLLWMTASWVWRGGRRRRRIGAAFVVIVVALLGVQSFLSSKESARRRNASAQPARCLGMGYSTMNNKQLLYQKGGMIEDLAATCPACGGAAERRAYSGDNFNRILDVMCALDPNDDQDFPAGPGTHVLFHGGTNDDRLWAITGPSTGRQKLALAIAMLKAFYVRDSETAVTNPRGWLQRSMQGALSVRDHQMAVIRQGLGCASARGASFLYVHDFMIPDLKYGRSPIRQELLDARREAVQSAGGDFIDHLQESRNRAGVSWFDDFIHLSTHGHREVADLMCASTRQPSAP